MSTLRRKLPTHSLAALLQLLLLGLLAFAPCALALGLSAGGGKCAASSPTGWPYAAFLLDSNATHVIVSHDPIPAGFIADCMHSVSLSRTINVSWSLNAPLAGHDEVALAAAVRLAAAAATSMRGAALAAVAMRRAAADPPPCTSTSFPIPFYSLAPNATCGDFPPWCSSELCMSFSFEFSSPGLVPATVPIDCQC